MTHRTGENRTGESRPVSLNFHDFSLLDGIVHMYTGTCLIEKWRCETSGQRQNTDSLATCISPSLRGHLVGVFVGNFVGNFVDTFVSISVSIFVYPTFFC